MARVIFPFPPLPARGNRRARDIGPALHHGQPVFIFDANEVVGIQPAVAVSKARAKLKELNLQPDDKLGWLGGDPAGLVIVSTLIAEMNSGIVNWMHFDRTRDTKLGRFVPDTPGYYVPTIMNTRRP